VTVLSSVVTVLTAQPTAQSCNASPDRPSQVNAARTPEGVIVSWTFAAWACLGDRYYLEASRGPTEVLEADTTHRSILLDLATGTDVPWRITVRSFTPEGLSKGASVLLQEGGKAPPPPCPSQLPAPTLVSAQTFGRQLFLQWQPDPSCLGSITNFLIAGSSTPDGPWLGTITVPYPNARSWQGEIPPGSYYVKVITQYYTRSSPPSASILVHAQ
jgi:hypothetical protein